MDVMMIDVERKTCSCGCVFWLTKGFVNRLKDNHKTYYCPACNLSWHFPQKTDAEIYEEKYNKEKESKEFYSKEYDLMIEKEIKLKNSLRTYKGIISKYKKGSLKKVSPKNKKQGGNKHAKKLSAL